MSYFGLDKIFKFFKLIKRNGGIFKSYYKLYRMDDLRMGALVGVDKYGNKYFEDNSFFVGRNRYVEYSPSVGMDYDGSQIPVEWYGWMHYKTDLLPKDEKRPHYSWMATDHKVNKSGTNECYVPYSTTKPKIQAWQPPKSK